MYFSVSAIDDISGRLGVADLLVAFDAETDAGRLTVRVDVRHGRHVQARFLVDDAAVGIALRRTGMALDHVDALDEHAFGLAILGFDTGHGTAAALVLAGQYADDIALLDLGSHD